MPATIEEHDSEAETCAPDSIGDNLAYQECEDSADEEFFDCSEVASLQWEHCSGTKSSMSSALALV